MTNDHRLTAGDRERPRPLRPLERLLGLALLTGGLELTAGAWHDAAIRATFSIPAAFAGPALAVIGLGLSFAPIRGDSAGAQLLRLTPRWVALVLLGLLFGAVDVAHLRGW
ncbi:MAG: hypothetical protein ACHQXA_08575 [Gemmatimonadales bacterium]